MRTFEGNINGKIYTNEKEFNKALLLLDDTADNVYVSYRYVSVPDTNDNAKLDGVKNEIECDKNYVSENQYFKNIVNKKDIELDAELVKKIKNASNQLEIKETVDKKITYFDNKISNNLLYINDLKTDHKKLEEKINLINSQIKTLDDANNNYYLNKEYYTNIKDLFVEVDAFDSNDECECVCDCEGGECTCGCEYKKHECDSEIEDIISLKDFYDMTPQEIREHLKTIKKFTLSDLVDYFLKN